MKIHEAIKEVMRRKGKPMTAKEVYKEIVKNRLYEFGAANPSHVVNTQIRRHCKGIPDKKSYYRTKYFEAHGNNKYYFLDSPEIVEKNKIREYWLPGINSSKPISSQEISIANPDFQVMVLREWFLSEYRPSNHVSTKNIVDVLDTNYNPPDVLNEEFIDILDTQIISKAASAIEQEFRCKEWFKRPNDEDIDEYYIENLDTNFFKNFKASTEGIKLLSTQYQVLREDLKQPLNRMLYASIITAMESYLSDAFINTVISNKGYVRKLVETNPDLRDRSMKLGDIFTQLDSINEEVKKYLIGKVVYHRLEKVEKMYLSTLDIKFPDNLDNLFRAVFNRHNIVHRNGKTEEGQDLLISPEDVQNLLDEVTSFIEGIDKQLR